MSRDPAGRAGAASAWAERYRIARDTILTMLPRGGTGAEIGVWKGDFSARILARATPARLHLIDPWQPAVDPGHARALYSAGGGADMEAIHRGVTERFADQIAAGTVVIHRAPSALAMAGFADASLDFVYVDGDHAHDAVRADMELALAKVRRGGLIAIDDYITGKWWGDDVIRAANGFIGDHAGEVALAFALAGQVALVRR